MGAGAGTASARLPYERRRERGQESTEPQRVAWDMATSVGKCFLLVWTGFTIGVMWMGAATECSEEQQYWWSSVNPFAVYKDLSRVQSSIFLRVFAPDVALQAGAGAATLISTLVGRAWPPSSR